MLLDISLATCSINDILTENLLCFLYSGIFTFPVLFSILTGWFFISPFSCVLSFLPPKHLLSCCIFRFVVKHRWLQSLVGPTSSTFAGYCCRAGGVTGGRRSCHNITSTTNTWSTHGNTRKAWYVLLLLTSSFVPFHFLMLCSPVINGEGCLIYVKYMEFTNVFQHFSTFVAASEKVLQLKWACYV